MNGSQDTPIYDRRKKKSIFKRIQPNLFNLVHLAFQDWKKKKLCIYMYTFYVTVLGVSCSSWDL